MRRACACWDLLELQRLLPLRCWIICWRMLAQVVDGCPAGIGWGMVVAKLAAAAVRITLKMLRKVATVNPATPGGSSLQWTRRREQQ